MNNYITIDSIKEHLELEESPDQLLEFRAREDIIERILELRDKKNVLILGHNYMEPKVYHLSEKQYRGDSLQLSRLAAQSNNPIILFDGVRFMAETAKILNPDKKVLIADIDAGCSLADPFTAKDVLEYKQKYPGTPVVTYINSYADIKAESDYCCTSANALKIVKHAANEYRTKKVIFFPDSLMGRNIQEELSKSGSDIELIYPGKYDDKYGRCEVHERIRAEDIKNIRKQHKLPKHDKSKVLEKDNIETAVLVHWECLPETVEEADFTGSTSEMIKYMAEHKNLKRVYLGTECEMTANLEREYPQIQFIKTCNIFCQHMRKITLEKILDCLENEAPEITVPEDIRKRALIPIERMLAIK